MSGDYHDLSPLHRPAHLTSMPCPTYLQHRGGDDLGGLSGGGGGGGGGDGDLQ
jgi:hypothetical protein